MSTPANGSSIPIDPSNDSSVPGIGLELADDKEKKGAQAQAPAPAPKPKPTLPPDLAAQVSALAENAGSDAAAVLGALGPAKLQRLSGEKMAQALAPVILKLTGADGSDSQRALVATSIACGLRVGLSEVDRRIAAVRKDLEGKIAEAQAAASAAQAAATTAQAMAGRSIWRVLFGLGPAQPKAPKPPKAAKAPKEAKPAADAGKK